MTGITIPHSQYHGQAIDTPDNQVFRRRHHAAARRASASSTSLFVRSAAKGRALTEVMAPISQTQTFRGHYSRAFGG
jgi:uncharacterized protein (UPF0303 family)